MFEAQLMAGKRIMMDGSNAHAIGGRFFEMRQRGEADCLAALVARVRGANRSRNDKAPR